jgi:hypothetical protein
MLLLLIAKEKCMIGVAYDGMMLVLNLIKIRPLAQKL